MGQILGILNSTHAVRLRPTPNSTRPCFNVFGPLSRQFPGVGRRADTGPVPSADWLHLYTEASRLAFADRALYVGDPDFVSPPRATG